MWFYYMASLFLYILGMIDLFKGNMKIGLLLVIFAQTLFMTGKFSKELKEIKEKL